MRARVLVLTPTIHPNTPTHIQHSGWIAPTSLVGFEEGMRKNFHATAKLAKNAKFLAGVEEAGRVWDEVHGSSHGVRTYARARVCVYIRGWVGGLLGG